MRPLPPRPTGVCDDGECTDKKSFLSIRLIWGLLHEVHGVVRHQSKRWHLPGYTGRGEHAADIGWWVNVLTVLHLVCQALPVDMEAGDTRVGGQNIPLELRERGQTLVKSQHYGLWRTVQMKAVGWGILTFSPKYGSISIMDSIWALSPKWGDDLDGITWITFSDL